MAQRAPHPCPGCRRLTNKVGRCERCARTRERAFDKTRPTANARGYTPRWRRYRLTYLAEHPLCRACDEQGRTTAATEIDHITPHRGNHKLMWDPVNLQPLCKSCHSRKTASEGRWTPRQGEGG